MFDNVRVNQNSLMNIVKLPERENTDSISRNPGSDFFAMVMEKSGSDGRNSRIDNKDEQNTEPQRKSEKAESPKTEKMENRAENGQVNSKEDRERVSADNKREDVKESAAPETKSDVKDQSIKKENISSAESDRTIRNKKKNEAESLEGINAAEQLQSEKNLKNLMDVLKALLNGDKKAEGESFQKLFNGLKLKNENEKENSSNGRYSFIRKNTEFRNHKNDTEVFNQLTKDIKDLLGKETVKNPVLKRTEARPVVLNDKELKELATNIIEGIKKNRGKETVKHEVKVLSGDEIRNDRKVSVAVSDEQAPKKITVSDNNTSDKNGSKEKNPNRESFNYNGNKIDISAKSGVERMDHSLKMSDFRENLQEIIDKAKVTVRDSRNGSFTVRLNPQELGNLNVNLVMENGVINGRFLVDNEEVKSALLSSLNDLKAQLEEAGISVGEFSVNVNDQREKYLKQKDDEALRALSFLSSDKEVIVAAEQYNSVSAVYSGHINMVI